jgi:hypothetical protein
VSHAWDIIWVAWLMFLVIVDLIANRTDGATFSEHCSEWFSYIYAKILLALFLMALYLHLAFSWSVYPLAILGTALVYPAYKSYRRKNGLR